MRSNSGQVPARKSNLPTGLAERRPEADGHPYCLMTKPPTILSSKAAIARVAAAFRPPSGCTSGETVAAGSSMDPSVQILKPETRCCTGRLFSACVWRSHAAVGQHGHENAPDVSRRYRPQARSGLVRDLGFRLKLRKFASFAEGVLLVISGRSGLLMQLGT